MRKKALLLGGTGAMGVYLAPKLIEKDYEVFITTRKKIQSDDQKLNYITGDAHDSRFLEVLLDDFWDVIIDFMLYSTEEFQSRFTSLLKKTDHYIFLSSYRVFAESDRPIIETSPQLLDYSTDIEYLKTDEYALSKARQERILRNSKFKNWTIVRPSITYSKNRLQLASMEAELIISRANLKVPVVVSKEIMKRKTTMTWAGDVAKMMAIICNNHCTLQEDYNVVTNEDVLWSDVGKIYSQNLNLSIYEIDHSKYLDVVGGNKYQIQYDRMFHRVMDNSKILTLTGFYQEDLKSINDGLTLEIRNTLGSNATSWKVNYSIHGRMDGILNTRISLNSATRIEKLKYYWNILKFRNR